MISCIIVAGGKSERMGQDKKFIEFQGKYFIEHVVEKARSFSDEIILSIGVKEQLRKTPPMGKLKIVRDEKEARGPIIGIFSGLKKCSNEYTVVLPCDSPFIEPRVFEYMIKERLGYDAVIPKRNNHVEPLHAVYKVPAMLKACEKVIEEGKAGVGDAIAKLERVKYISIETFRKHDKTLLTFYNINTYEDLNGLIKMAERGE
jgi:molybdopterin-guanine dinucleotide biosynthesis protein A